MLNLTGEQGTAKTTTAELLRRLNDPSVADVRGEPREEKDLRAAVANNHVIVFDNLSHMPPWLSDALCRIATGAGFAARGLYTDSEEIVVGGARPIILTGINEVATRGDLIDRSLFVTLSPIPDAQRQTKDRIFQRFDADAPTLLGALLEAVSFALFQQRFWEIGEEGPTDLPRMADFYRWVIAAEARLPWAPGTFAKTYKDSRRDATAMALESDPLAAAVIEFMDNKPEWTGTATDLLQQLSNMVDETMRRTKMWPMQPNNLTNRLNRLAPSLRKLGLDVDTKDRSGANRAVKLRRVPVGTD